MANHIAFRQAGPDLQREKRHLTLSPQHTNTSTPTRLLTALLMDPLQIISTCLECTPIPGLSTAFHIFQAIWTKVQDIQALKEQWLQLSVAVAQLLNTLNREYREGRVTERDTRRELQNLHRYGKPSILTSA